MTAKTKTPHIPPRTTYGITRIDSDKSRTHGFYVRVQGQSKLFSDKVYITKRHAREAAENYRDILWLRMTPKQQLRASKPRKK